jgi:glutamyl-tRNA reductase
MGIRLQPGETYDSWTSRVQIHELLIAKQKIAKGIPIDRVLEDMSKNIVKKLLHPLIKLLTNTPINMSEFEASKKAYEENYINKTDRVADHVDD